MASKTTNATVSASNITKVAEFGQAAIMWWSVIYGVVGLAVITSNALTVTAFTRLPHRKRRHVHLLLINLSITDLLVGGVTIPLLIWKENTQWSASLYEYIWTSFVLFHWMSLLESAFSIVLISMDRLHAVGRPLRHRVLTTRPYFTVMLITWFLAAALSALMSFSQNLHFSHTAFINVMVPSLSIPLVITAIAYTTLWSIKKRSQSLQESIRPRQFSEDPDRKLIRTLFIVTVVYFATCSPYVIVRAVRTYAGVSVSDHVYALARLLQYSNSFCNPIIYWFTDPVFATVLKNIVRKSPRESSRSSRPQSRLIELQDVKTPNEFLERWFLWLLWIGELVGGGGGGKTNSRS